MSLINCRTMLRIPIKAAKYARSLFESALHGSLLTKEGRALSRIIRAESGHVAPFKKALKQYGRTFSAAEPISITIKSYKDKKVRPAGTMNHAPPPHEPILLCIVKNGLEKVMAQVSYHRKLGVRHFAYIDNFSSDGTYEWLEGQDDVYLFAVDEDFHGCRKAAWKRQAMDILGYGRWYLILDHDEFFCYPGAPQIPLPSYIAHLESRGYRSAHAPMIDMYPKGAIFTASPGVGFMDSHCYFDADTYRLICKHRRVSIKGGPRTRVRMPAPAAPGPVGLSDAPFSSPHRGKHRIKPALSKYPLVYAENGMLFGNHMHYPHRSAENPKKPTAFLLHYIYLPSDAKYSSDIIKADEAGGSGYAHSNVVRRKAAMEAYGKNPHLSLYYEGSQKLESPMDLLKINICDRGFFKGFLEASDNAAK